MITSIHQPSFFPWLGLLDKIAKSEQFIFLDDVHANKASFQYRNKFYCEGESKFITLPVNYRSGIRLNELEFKNSNWKVEHLNKIRNYYIKAPFFQEIYPALSEFYLDTKEDIKPIDFIINTMFVCFKWYAINVITVRSSEIDYCGQKGDLVLNICMLSNTSVYVSGSGAKVYMDDAILNSFQKNNIKINWHTFSHPVYLQNRTKSFVPGLTSLDMLFYNGIDKSREIFWNNVKS